MERGSPHLPRTQSFLLSLSVGSIWAEGSTGSVLLAGRGRGVPKGVLGTGMLAPQPCPQGTPPSPPSPQHLSISPSICTAFWGPRTKASRGTQEGQGR